MPFVPLNKPSKEVVLDLINVSNPKDQNDPDGPRLDLTLTQVDLVFPRVGEQPGKNTTVDLVALPGFEYPGDVAIHYDRLDMSRFGVGGTRQLDGYYFTVSQLLVQLNATFDLGIVPSEVQYAEVDDEDWITVNISESLAYIPTTTLRVKEGFFSLVQRLETTVTETLLSIGTAPLPGMPAP